MFIRFELVIYLLDLSDEKHKKMKLIILSAERDWEREFKNYELNEQSTENYPVEIEIEIEIYYHWQRCTIKVKSLL